MSSENSTIDKVNLVDDFTALVQGKMDKNKVAAAAKALTADVTAYPATGSVASLIFYLKFQVIVKNGGKTFDGNAGGVATPGGGALFGDVYTDDINALYSNTVSFAFTATPVYTALYFFDSNHNLLGHFQAGAVSIISGTGGGTGKWS
jgi:hypothetical protein